jgi:hypothetical protein
MPFMHGYSGTPIVKKLGIKPGFKIWILGFAGDYAGMVAPLPPGVSFGQDRDLDFVHGFFTQREIVTIALPKMIQAIRPNGMIWISWPKKSARVETDLTESVLRDLALPLGIVDIKVCAVTEVWSGLKFVIRKELRI